MHQTSCGNVKICTSFEMVVRASGSLRIYAGGTACARSHSLVEFCQSSQGFNSADVAVVTKMDLAPAVEFDWSSAYGNIQAVRPGMPVFQLSAKTGDGINEYLNFLTARLDELRTPAAS